MAQFVPFDPSLHLDAFRQMNIASLQWHAEELQAKYGIDAVSLIDWSIEEYVDANLERYTLLKPPAGVVTILEVEGKAAGMLALSKLSDDTGELHRMWINPDCRGNGYGRPLLDNVLGASRALRCSRIKLSTPRFALAAQRLYRSAGFKETGEYPESEVHPLLRPYWMYMEKKA
jgi:ribosomal protein S18 acetylase RimI-like enzyme